MTNIFQPNLQTYSLTVEGLSCFAHGYTDMSSKKPLLLLVHGSPGEAKDWNKYLKDNDLSSKYRILALDRPGYGQSVKKGVLAFPSIEFQAKVVHRFIQKFANRQPVVLVGHSVGGPIVAHFATEYSTDIQALVLLAPAISAKHEQPRWYNHLAAKRWIHKRIGLNMQISQAEMMNLSSQLEALTPHLQAISCETWLFHSKIDFIAPYGNALHVQKNLTNATLHFQSYLFRSHFIHLTKYNAIKKVLLEEILP